MKSMRIAFFADLHIRRDKLQAQTDLGAPSRVIARKAQRALNDLEPDLIFGLGDLTAESAADDWQGYHRWLQGVNAPVFDVLGNHDRDYTVFNRHRYGEEYFHLLGRVSGTKALRVGNTVFILISEEHNPEGAASRLTSTVPAKRFRFVEDMLKAHSQDSNVFVLSHTLLQGTTALSNDWVFNDKQAWTHVTRRFFQLFERYPVVAHLTGHTHIDYRYQSYLKNLDGSKRGKKVGKFVDGRQVNGLPDIYFLNMPCVDTAHGWFGSNFALLRELSKSTAQAKRSPFRKLYMALEEKGPPLFDIVYRSPINNVLGRAAIYYVDLFRGREQTRVTTRWLRTNRDVEQYRIDLHQPIELGRGRVDYLGSDLSIRTKRNLSIQRDDWFAVPAGELGWGLFSQRFSDPVSVLGLRIESADLRDYAVRWRGSKDGGQTWQESWHTDPQALGRVNAVMIEVDLRAGAEPALVRDMVVEAEP